MNKPYWFPDARSLIAILLIVSMVAMTFTLMIRPSVADSDILKVMLGGFMTVGFSSVIQYYFGSSSSSKDKDDTISRMSGAPPPDESSTTSKTETTKTTEIKPIEIKPEGWTKP